MKKVSYSKGQFNCAETIAHSYNENNNKNIPIALGSGMGTGLTVGSVCGAINMGVAIISLEKGRNSPEQFNEARILVNEYMKRMQEEYGTDLCIPLKKSGVSCSDIVEFAYTELEKILENN